MGSRSGDVHAQAADTAAVARGSRHTAVAQMATQCVRFATTVALARLLTPEDFGVVAIAMVVTMVVDQFKDLGTGSALVQRGEVDEPLLNAVFALNLILGCVLGGLMVAGAEILASLLGSPDAVDVLRVFGAITVVTSLGQIHHALLRRHLRFYELALVTTLTAVITGVVSIVLAVLGLGYWSLVFGTALGSGFGTVAVWHFDRWRPTRGWDLRSLQTIWSYSWNLFMSNVLVLIFTQADKVIISRFLGSTALGTYTLGQRIVTSPVTAVGAVVAEVAFPAFARRQHDHEALRRGFIRSSQVIALITFPGMAGVAILAGPLVEVVLGQRWVGLVPVIWFLSFSSAIQSVTNNSAQLLLAKGRSDIIYRWAIFYCVVITVLELYAVRWGLVGVAAGFAAGVLVLTPFGLILAFRQIQMRLWTFVVALGPQFALTAVMAVAVLITSWGVAQGGGGDVARLLSGFAVGGGVYVGLLLVVRPPALQDFLLVAGMVRS